MPNADMDFLTNLNPIWTKRRQAYGRGGVEDPDQAAIIGYLTLPITPMMHLRQAIEKMCYADDTFKIKRDRANQVKNHWEQSDVFTEGKVKIQSKPLLVDESRNQKPSMPLAR